MKALPSPRRMETARSDVFVGNVTALFKLAVQPAPVRSQYTCYLPVPAVTRTEH